MQKIKRPRFIWTEEERTALKDLFSDTYGPGWRDQKGWKKGIQRSKSQPEDWYGITCYEPDEDHPEGAYEIDLSANRLRGAIPASIGRLKRLIFLDLAHNQIRSLPDTLAQLT